MCSPETVIFVLVWAVQPILLFTVEGNLLVVAGYIHLANALWMDLKTLTN